MKDPHTILLSQIISEKGTDMASGNNQYLFRVARSANKIEVAYAVEKIFKVKVAAVQIMNRPGKPKRRGASIGMTAASRRAVVRLKPNNSIQLA
ncbi:MAG: 50S ribosomal protein L23 [bacterium]|nr:50S ribosomal protein L23 [bacterium]